MPAYAPIIEWEIFMLKIICVKNFRVVEFLQFHSIRKIFILVDGCNIDEHLAFSLHVSGEPGIAGCSRRLDIYLRECGLARKLIHATYFC